MTQTETPENEIENTKGQNEALEPEISAFEEIEGKQVTDSIVDEDLAIESNEATPSDAQSEKDETSSENADETSSDTLILSDSGEIVWNNVAIARLLPNQPLLAPKFELVGPELNQAETAKIVAERLDGWLIETIRTDLAPLFRLKRAIEFVAPIVPVVEIVAKSKSEKNDAIEPSAEVAASALPQEDQPQEIEIAPAEVQIAPQSEEVENIEIEPETAQTEENEQKSDGADKKPKKPVRQPPKEFSPAAKEIAQLVFENCGILDRNQFEAKISALSQDNRRELRSAGIKFGRNAIYLPLLLKPKPARLNVILSSLSKGPIGEKPLLLPPVGVTSFEAIDGYENKDYLLCGFQKLGARAIRLDIVDRVLDTLFDAAKAAKGGFEMPIAVVSLLGVSNEAAQNIVTELGWSAETGEDGVKKWRLKRVNTNFKRPDNQAASKPWQKGARKTDNQKQPERKSDSPRVQNAHTKGFKKKHSDKGEKMRTPREFSARPSRNIEDSPFAILAGLKAELQNKKE